MIENHKVVSSEEWLTARRELVEKEKQLTRMREEVTKLRGALPWEAVTKEYVFDGPRGKTSLPALFDGRSQLIVYHFMFPPDWEAGCKHCSFRADNFDGIIAHLAQRDVTMVCVSRAPREKLAAYQKRMGWSFDWFSSGGTDFSFDYHVAFTPEELANKHAFYNFAMREMTISDREGHSVFYKDAQGAIFHTYSSYDRGNEMLHGAYHYLDIVPKGRDEGERGPYWVRRKDEYGK